MRVGRKRLVHWGVLILLVISPVLVVEIYLRAAGLGDPILYYENSSYRYAPVPNQQVTRRRGATVTIDFQGLRGVKEWTGPADTKVLFIGESITWSGTYIDDTQTFPHLTCVYLQEQLGGQFTCGNAGVNAYGTDNMAERIRFGHIRDENVIVVTIASLDALRGLLELGSLSYFSAPPYILKFVGRIVVLIAPKEIHLLSDRGDLG